MSAYARNIGIDYLQNTIKDLIDNVIRADENLEVCFFLMDSGVQIANGSQ
jgi:hypothetical protein